MVGGWENVEETTTKTEKLATHLVVFCGIWNVLKQSLDLGKEISQ